MLSQDSADKMFSTALLPWAASCGAKARVTARVPKKWVSSSSRMAARSPVSSEDPVDEPALLTRIATPFAVCAAAATDAGSATSRAIGVTPAISSGEVSSRYGVSQNSGPLWSMSWTADRR